MTGFLFNVGINAKPYQQGINQMKSANNSLENSLGKLKNILGTTFSFLAVKKGIEDTTKAFFAQENAEKRLESIAKQVLNANNAQISGLKKLASELQKVSVIGDEVSISGMSQLATFKLSTDSIAKLTPALQTLAVAQYGTNVSQEQIIQTANLLGKSYQGMSGALSRVGITLDETQEQMLKTGTEEEKVATLTNIVNQNFGNLAQSMRNTNQGSLQAFKNAWGDLYETIGGKIAPVLTNVANTLTNKVIPALSDFVTNPIKSLEKLWSGMNILQQSVIGVTTAFVGLKVAGAAWTFLTNIFDSGAKLIVTGFKALFSWPALILGSVYLLRVGWEKDWLGMRTTITKVWDIIGPVFSAIGTWLFENGKKAIDWIWNLGGKAWDWLTTSWKTVQPYVQEIIDFVFTGVSQAAEWIWNFGGKAWDWLTTSWKIVQPYVKEIVDFIFTGVSQVINWTFNILGGAWNWLMDNGKTFLDLGKGLWNWLSDITGKTWSLALDGFNIIKNLFSDIATGIKEGNWQDIWNALVNFGKDFVKWVWKGIQNVWDSVVNLVVLIDQTFQKLFPNLYDFGLKMVEYLANGIKAVWNGIMAFGTWIKDGIISSYNIITDAGKNVLDFIKNGIVNSWNSVMDFGKWIIDGIANVSTSIFQAGIDFANSLWDGIKSVLSNLNPFNWFKDEAEIEVNVKYNGAGRDFANGTVPAFANGNTAFLDRSGFIHGKGTGTSDSNLAWLSDGEAVINAKSTKKYWKILKLINENKYASGNIPQFATGTVRTSITGGTRDTNIFTDISDVFKSDISNLKKVISLLAEQLGLNFDAYGDTEETMKTLQTQMENLSVGVENTVLSMADLTKSVQEEFDARRKQTMELLSNQATGPEDLISKLSTSLISNIQTGIGLAIDTASNLFTGLSAGLGMFAQSLGSTLGIMTLLVPIFQGFMSVVGPQLTKTLKPFFDSLNKIGAFLGGVISPLIGMFAPAIELIGHGFDLLLKVLNPVIVAMSYIGATFSWLGDQLILFVNSIPFIGGFLTEAEKRQKSIGISARATQYQQFTPDESNTNVSALGDTFSAGSTQQNTFNYNIVNNVTTLAEEGIQELAEKIAQVISRRPDLQAQVGGL